MLTWNCRGASSGQFLRSMKELMRIHHPHILVILEPKTSGLEADEACHRIGKKDWVRSEARGFSGGIWILWDRLEINLQVNSCRATFYSSIHDRE